MSRVDQLEEQIAALDPDELRILREWFARFDADDWDRQMEKDFAPGGRGEHLLDKIKNQVKAGNFTPLEEGFRLSQEPQPASK